MSTDNDLHPPTPDGVARQSQDVCPAATRKRLRRLDHVADKCRHQIGGCTRASGVSLRPDQVARQTEQRHRCAPVRVRPHRARSPTPQRGHDAAGPPISARASISRTASARSRASATSPSACRSSCGVRRASRRPNSADRSWAGGPHRIREPRTLPYQRRRTKAEPTRFADTARPGDRRLQAQSWQPPPRQSDSLAPVSCISPFVARCQIRSI